MVLNDNIIHLKTSFLVWISMNNKSPHISVKVEELQENREDLEDPEDPHPPAHILLNLEI